MLVLFYNAKLRPLNTNFKLSWAEPYRIVEVFSNGTVQLADLDGKLFAKVVNGSEVKPYIDEYSDPLDSDSATQAEPVNILPDDTKCPLEDRAPLESRALQYDRTVWDDLIS